MTTKCTCPNPKIHAELAGSNPIDPANCYKPEPTRYYVITSSFKMGNRNPTINTGVDADNLVEAILKMNTKNGFKSEPIHVVVHTPTNMHTVSDDDVEEAIVEALVRETV